jgi:chromosome segregation ATPase
MKTEPCKECPKLKAELAKAKKNLQAERKAARSSIDELGREVQQLTTALRVSESLCRKTGKAREAYEAALAECRKGLASVKSDAKKLTAELNTRRKSARAKERQIDALTKARDSASQARQDAIERRGEALAAEMECQAKVRGLEVKVAELREALAFKDACEQSKEG